MGDHLPPLLQDEIWKDIPGYEGLYQASNRGRVWSVPRQVWIKCSGKRGYWRTIGGKLLAPSPNSDGYLQVTVCCGGTKQTKLIHQLVMRAFVGEPGEGQEVCHGEAGKLVNWWPENLSYGTYSQNNGIDRIRDGTDHRGERSPNAKLAESDVLEIRRLHNSTLHLARYHPERWTMQKLADKYDVGMCTIRDLLQGKTWSHLAA